MKRRGISLCVLIALAATVAGHFVPLIGAAVFSIIIGMCVRPFVDRQSVDSGAKFCSKKVLQASIVMMGLTLNFRAVAELGWSSLPLTLTTIAVALIAGVVLGRTLKVSGKIRTLISVGTAICGGSAIAAVSPIIEADEEEVAYAISTIFLFNVIAVFLFPVMGHALHMSEVTFGYLAGSAINDTSSVVAAGYTYGNEAGNTATIVKLLRALMIVPLCLMIVWMNRKQVSVKRIFPWFILYFCLASIAATIIPIPEAVNIVIKQLSVLMIAVAMSGIGLSVNIRQFRRLGYQPVLLGALLWFTVTAMSLIMLHIK
ncbi:YeiH family protein [Macrococcus carouselicus]|uniref:YeiH family putative sulfate export transporter n=1 Tax=Macrococcus carouselicus TaxID=69969 RepID=A0A9Q8CL37_9STAP|nr:YeiH family protein [Macrococcus carouselicus]TDM00801.1 YeiH family putative sulfate export transporter [Macrococcus carouselicus]